MKISHTHKVLFWFASESSHPRAGKRKEGLPHTKNRIEKVHFRCKEEKMRSEALILIGTFLGISINVIDTI